MLETKRRQNVLQPTDTIVTTLVTSGLVRRIGETHGLSVIDGLQVGFKWIGRTIDDIGPEHFVFGCEESHGYLAGTHVRDKDASVAALLFAELAAELKAQGRTLHQKLDDLFLHTRVSSRTAGGDQVAREQQVWIACEEIMAGLRANPPTELGGLAVRRTRDYGQLKVHDSEQGEMPFERRAGRISLSSIFLMRIGTGEKRFGASISSTWQCSRGQALGHRTQNQVLSFCRIPTDVCRSTASCKSCIGTTSESPGRGFTESSWSVRIEVYCAMRTSKGKAF